MTEQQEEIQEEMPGFPVEKTDSIKVDKGKTGKYSFAVKIYGDLNKEGEAMLEKIEQYITTLNVKYGGESNE